MISKFKELLYCVIAGIIIIFVFKYFGANKYSAEIPKPIDSVWNYHIEYRDTIFNYPIVQATLDTVYIDSLGQNLVTASADSIVITGGNIISVRYFYPPLNYFAIKAHLSEKTIYNTLTITKINEPPKPKWYEELINRFGISIQSGVGMGLITKQVDVYVGIGASFEL